METRTETDINRTAQDRRAARQPDEHELGPDLIASDKVEDTDVYRPDGEKIGKVDHFMVGKRSGVVEYAVMSFGGFLGMGKELRPIPWDALDYDTEMDGYVVSAEEDVLRDSPSFERRHAPVWDSAYATRVYNHWGLRY